MIEVTMKEFQEKVDKVWGEIFKCFDQLPENEAILKKEKLLNSLNDYQIVLEHKVIHSNPVIVKIIERFSSTSERQENGTMRFTGFCPTDYMSASDYRLLHSVLTERSEWSDGYRQVFVSSKDHVMVTFCEGDITINVFTGKEAYEKEYEKAKEFYETYA